MSVGRERDVPKRGVDRPGEHKTRRARATSAAVTFARGRSVLSSHSAHDDNVRAKLNVPAPRASSVLFVFGVDVHPA